MTNRWGNNGNSDRLLFPWAPKSRQLVTVAMKLRCLLLGRIAMTNLDSILKSRDIICRQRSIYQSYGFFQRSCMDVEHWTIKKVDHQRNYTFELSSWQRLLRVPWTARRSNRSILKEINPEYSLEGLMLKLKLQHFGHLL